MAVSPQAPPRGERWGWFGGKSFFQFLVPLTCADLSDPSCGHPSVTCRSVWSQHRFQWLPHVDVSFIPSLELLGGTSAPTGTAPPSSLEPTGMDSFPAMERHLSKATASGWPELGRWEPMGSSWSILPTLSPGPCFWPHTLHTGEFRVAKLTQVALCGASGDTLKEERPEDDAPGVLVRSPLSQTTMDRRSLLTALGMGGGRAGCPGGQSW